MGRKSRTRCWLFQSFLSKVLLFCFPGLLSGFLDEIIHLGRRYVKDSLYGPQFISMQSFVEISVPRRHLSVHHVERNSQSINVYLISPCRSVLVVNGVKRQQGVRPKCCSCLLKSLRQSSVGLGSSMLYVLN